jgi:hypothetical protein
LPKPKRNRTRKPESKLDRAAARYRPHARARELTELPPDWGDNSQTYESRMKAAGFGPDAPRPKDIDAFRYSIARRLAMIVNNWRGCPEGLCRRHRGCMAPHIHCTNTAPPNATPEQLARTLALVQRIAREAEASCAAEEGDQCRER